MSKREKISDFIVEALAKSANKIDFEDALADLILQREKAILDAIEKEYKENPAYCEFCVPAIIRKLRGEG